MECGQCGAEYKRASQRFCHKCGAQLIHQNTMIFCPNCNRRTARTSRCSACGAMRTYQEIKMYHHLTKMDDRLQSLETKIQYIMAMVRRLKSADLDSEEGEIERIDIYSQQDTLEPINEDPVSAVMEETISHPEITDLSGKL